MCRRICSPSQSPVRYTEICETAPSEMSARMMFAEEQDRYLATVRRFLDRISS